MGFFDGYNIAVSGMSAQRTRINVVSANIANAKTTHTAEGGPYKKQDVVFEEVLLQENNKSNKTSEKNIVENPDLSLRGVGVKSIVEDDAQPVMRYEPSHPDANEDGYVAYPNINPVIEMVNLIEAMRSYEANVSAFSTHKSIDSKTLDIIKV
ncbi:flagellar basal body rod protein FlgC [Halarcobacter ebronensis]|uniref:Flagellar basal-body rod protein FlgC n=1 Tax=Halarcobacter ebronensis TaxID=1462615 RepID=A0A4Q0YG79_9BACT|nr:flagellar basal body rod protein FlgC [Halarcobacter ebronensis]QKF82893.1 flagellar proximal rod protein FlgC [Halarcobacter ebronensis]RXJ69597.1 flagellar basal body rod protein FlgC [Halarcobacter ebronensis]RXK06910.1 flagellar basal body rod protein FlgC [Halarcobacter ebronensis]